MSTPSISARGRRRAAILGLAILIAAGGVVPALSATEPTIFDTPEAAEAALIAAVRQNDLETLVAILGEGADELLESGDPVQDASRRQRFLQLYDEQHTLVPAGDGRLALVIGAGAWPYPIPLATAGTGWSFDLASGIEEVVNRRIGENELLTIRTCLAVVDAQREYSSRDRDGDGILEYAQKIRSTVGRQDGLFWRAREGEPESPLGELAAAAAAEGYTASDNAYHGYHFRLLYAQGPGARGGAYDYVVRDDQIGGFALVAFPARYGDSGIMTFTVNHDGVVYQRDLGPDTAVGAESIAVFDPVAPWEPVPEADLAAALSAE